jgi:transcriptional regulator with XRE-family HTH domain
MFCSLLIGPLREPQSFVSKYEIGERRLDMLDIRAICEAVGITLEEFVGILEGSLARRHDYN